MEIISIGDRIFPGEYSLHSSFRNVVNLTDGESLVSLVTRKVGSGPVNIVADGLDPGSIETLRIDRETIFINGDSYFFDRRLLFYSHSGTGPVDKGHLAKHLLIFEDSLLELSPPKSLAFLIDKKREDDFRSSFEKGFAERMKGGVGDILGLPGGLSPKQNNIVVPVFPVSDPGWRDRGRSVHSGSRTEVLHYESPPDGKFWQGIKHIKGLGFGLTPSGDDFIAGLLVALNMLERLDQYDRSNLKNEIVSISRGGNLLSNSFISLAASGYLFEGFKILLETLLQGSGTEVRTATKKLLFLGASSGSDMAVGFLLTIKKFLDLT